MTARPPSDSGYAFDDDGGRVGVVGFTYPDDGDADELRAEDSARLRQETLSRTLDMLCDGATDAATIGRRVAVMAFLSRGESRPRTLAELGRLLGVTRARACQIVGAFKLAQGFNRKAARKA